MKTFTQLSITLSCIASSGASIVKGFATREVPSLDEIPNIAKQLRRLSPAGRKAKEHAVKPRVLKKGSKKDSSKERGSDEQQSQNQGDGNYPYIPEAPPEFNDAGELSFVIVSVG